MLKKMDMYERKSLSSLRAHLKAFCSTCLYPSPLCLVQLEGCALSTQEMDDKEKTCKWYINNWLRGIYILLSTWTGKRMHQVPLFFGSIVIIHSLAWLMVTLGCALQGGERTSRHGLHATCGILSSQRCSHSHDQSPPRTNKVSHNP